MQNQVRSRLSLPFCVKSRQNILFIFFRLLLPKEDIFLDVTLCRTVQQIQITIFLTFYCCTLLEPSQCSCLCMFDIWLHVPCHFCWQQNRFWQHKINSPFNQELRQISHMLLFCVYNKYTSSLSSSLEALWVTAGFYIVNAIITEGNVE